MNTQALTLATPADARALDDTDLEAVTGGNWLSNFAIAAAAALGIGAVAAASGGSSSLAHAVSSNVATPDQESANLAG